MWGGAAPSKWRDAWTVRFIRLLGGDTPALLPRFSMECRLRVQTRDSTSKTPCRSPRLPELPTGSATGPRPTPRVTGGTRGARTLRHTFRGDVGRSRDSKARARPARQVHALVIGPVRHEGLLH